MTTAAQNMLYTQVSGVLFAPEGIQIEKHIIIKSNVGVVPSSTLIETFEHVNFEVLQQFLIYNEFCHKVEDHTTLQLIEGDLSSEAAEPPPTESSNKTDSETQSTSASSYFFFPELVKAEKPEDIMKSGSMNGYT